MLLEAGGGGLDRRDDQLCNDAWAVYIFAASAELSTVW